ncbi:DUF2059 domain-containing protein [Flavobacterium agricola]|uniref:DUF2059 domain-containing protein n=1 Tax=Flavobacterium agricola TaxID=2870839 RepID=A0ABY6LWI9_9FLAO|nr:DUF2059 domain-containing protein [Flavobacterium agricola]UYW00626.1 DUF2059 domain-containing protein [Flavobacterium agricola]
MKKLFFTALVIGFVQFAQAQQPSVAEVKEVMVLAGVNDQYDVALEQVIGMIPEAKQADFKKDFQGILDRNTDKVAEIWIKYYTKAEIAELKNFYNSSIGKKMKENNAKITRDVIANQQALMTEMQEAVMKYMQ